MVGTGGGAQHLRVVGGSVGGLLGVAGTVRGSGDGLRAAFVGADSVVVAAVGVGGGGGRNKLRPSRVLKRQECRFPDGHGGLSWRGAHVYDRVRLAAKRVVEMLDDAVLPVCGDVGEPHVLHRVVEVVRAGLGGAENLASLAVALPQEAAAGVGVRERGSVEVGGRAEAVLVVVDGLLVCDDRVIGGETRGAAEGRTVGGIGLYRLVSGECGRRGRRPSRAGATALAYQLVVGERVGVDREGAVLGKGFRDRAAHEERRAVARGGVGDLVGVGVNGRDARCPSDAVPNGQDARCPSAPGFALDGGVAVAGEAGVAGEGAGDEGCDAVRHDVARLGARARRVVGMARVAVKRLVAAHGHEGIDEDRCVVQHVGDDVGEGLRHGGVSALLHAQGLVAVLVIVGVRPGAGVAPDEARLSVAARVLRVVPVVGLRPFHVPTVVFLAVCFTENRVVALAHAALLRDHR